MNRRDYIRTISTAATANLVLDDFIETKPENSESKKYVFRRGVQGEIKIVIQKFEEYDEPKLKIFDSRGKQIHSFPREKDTPFPHIGRYQTIMYKNSNSLRETVFLSYFDSLGNRVRGMWVTGDKAMSQQGEDQ
jgi:hypothetical protein